MAPHPAADSGDPGDLRRDQPWLHPLQILHAALGGLLKVQGSKFTPPGVSGGSKGLCGVLQAGKGVHNLEVGGGARLGEGPSLGRGCWGSGQPQGVRGPGGFRVWARFRASSRV